MAGGVHWPRRTPRDVVAKLPGGGITEAISEFCTFDNDGIFIIRR